MPLRARYLQPQIEADLARKMVFVAGPRQVGKTTLARILARCDEARYAPASVTAPQCREGMQGLLDLIDAERIEPVWTPVPPPRRAEAQQAWDRLRERYPAPARGAVAC